MQHEFFTDFNSLYILTYSLMYQLRMKDQFEEGNMTIGRYYIGPKGWLLRGKHTLTTIFLLLVLRRVSHTFFSQRQNFQLQSRLQSSATSQK